MLDHASSYLGFVLLGPLLASIFPVLAVAGPLLAGVVLGVTMSSVAFSVINWGIPALFSKKNRLQEEPTQVKNSLRFIEESLESRTNSDSKTTTRITKVQVEQNQELKNQDSIINLTQEMEEDSNELSGPGMGIGLGSM